MTIARHRLRKVSRTFVPSGASKVLQFVKKLRA
jgi:hypothetical protein